MAIADNLRKGSKQECASIAYAAYEASTDRSAAMPGAFFADVSSDFLGKLKTLGEERGIRVDISDLRTHGFISNGRLNLRAVIRAKHNDRPLAF